MKFVNLLNIPPGLLLFAAAILKCYQLIQNPVAFGELWSGAFVGILVLTFEFIVGSLLLFPGILSFWTKPTGIGVYGFFLVYTLWGWASGKVSCGCLGLVEVPIAVMSLIDLGMLVSLAAWRQTNNPTVRIRPNYRTLLISVVTLLAFVTGPLAFFASRFEVRYVNGADEALGEFFAEGEFVYIKPDDWLGKKFPLARYVSCDDVLQGDWTVVFYNEGCPKCQDIFHEIFAKEQGRYLLVKVISTSTSRKNDSEFIKWRTLPETHEWFVQPPKIVELSEGIVTTVK